MKLIDFSSYLPLYISKILSIDESYINKIIVIAAAAFTKKIVQQKFIMLQNTFILFIKYFFFFLTPFILLFKLIQVFSSIYNYQLKLKRIRYLIVNTVLYTLIFNIILKQNDFYLYCRFVAISVDHSIVTSVCRQKYLGNIIIYIKWYMLFL